MRILSLLIILSALVSCSSKKKVNSDAYALMPESASSHITEKAVANLIESWPDHSRGAAKAMIERYKLPQEVTSTKLTWFENGKFKRSTVHRDGALHQFPMAHFDVLEQVIDYRIPFNKVDDLWNFNGSIVLAKTIGEMSTWANNEEMNILTLNLAHEVITDKRSANEARKELTKIISLAMKGSEEMDPKMKDLQFSPSEKAMDPDFIMIKEEEHKKASVD